MTRFENETTVFVNASWSQEEKCIVVSYVENESSTGKNIYGLRSVASDGTFGATEDCVFSTKEEAHAASVKKSAELVEKYKREIKDLTDLLRFPFNHCFNDKEHAEYEAEQAYRIRANELTGIILQ